MRTRDEKHIINVLTGKLTQPFSASFQTKHNVAKLYLSLFYIDILYKADSDPTRQVSQDREQNGGGTKQGRLK